MIDFNKNRRFRRLILAWWMGFATTLVYWAMRVWVVQSEVRDIPSNVLTLLLAVLGLNTVLFAFYQWHRGKDEERYDKDRYATDDK